MSQTEESVVKKCRGRPKVFDREIALDKALMLFWTHGYEGTSMADLVAATGAKAPTLYAEFENKEGLFRAAMQRYTSRFGELRNQSLTDDSLTVATGVERYFRTTADCFTDRNSPTGCFFICTSTALSASSGEIARMLQRQHQSQEVTLKGFLQQRQQRGELKRDIDIDALSRYLGCMLEGMSVRAREGSSREELHGIIDTLMALWPALTGHCQARA